MNKLLLAVLLIFITAGSAKAGDSYYAESQNYFTDKVFVPQVQSFYSHSFTDTIGAYVFFQVYPTWAQVYAGPTFTLAPWIQIGVGGGIEQSPKQWRTGNFAYLSQGAYSALLVFEYGPSGYAYIVDAGKQVNNNLSLGIFAQRFTGIGPKVSYAISNSPISFWAVPSYDPESKLFGAVASVRGTFNQ